MSEPVKFIPRDKVYPQLYVYSDERYPGKLKVGYTKRENVEDRINEQYPVILPTTTQPYKLLYKTEAIKDNGNYFLDKEVHRHLVERNIEKNGEWFTCELDVVKAAVLAVKKGIKNEENRTETFSLRPEQKEAVTMTADFFKKQKAFFPERAPHFLWNAKMRFGKTFTAYQLALKMGWTRVLVATYKPAVESSWKEDLLSHVDFEGWQFVSNGTLHYDEINQDKPYVTFVSLQDLLGTNLEGEIKVKNEWIHLTDWDCVIFDEYHFGAWKDTAKELFESEQDESEFVEDINEQLLRINAGAYLYLSGTPFRAITSGEFTEDQIFNWTYSDEQRAKNEWVGANNPYESLPQLMMLTYRLPDSIREVALKGEFNEFDLNYFFKASGLGAEAKFDNVNDVQKWLDLIRGNLGVKVVDDLKAGKEKPPYPYEDVNLKKILTHTVWFLPGVSACHAMNNLLKQPQNVYYQDFNIVVAAGAEAGVGIRALEPVRKAMGNPLNTKTITLTCGKLTTGVTVKPWTGIFMLRSLKTPETYFQAAFRVQSPWVLPGEDEPEIMKKQCFIFDFAPDRALHQIASYADRLDSRDISPEVKVAEFIHYLPVLAYDGFAMEQVDAAGLLDLAMGRTTATLLARGWNNAMLVNVDTDTLKRLSANEKAMNAITSIESFRNTKDDLDVIISKSDSIEKLKKKRENGQKLTPKEKEKLDKEQKEYNSKRDEIREKLKTLATRIPLFMYLTDKRENTLKEVILKLEPTLFVKVTGLTIEDFELLVDLGVFNSALMNKAVYNFRSYEDASLSYSGINKHAGEKIGLFE